MRAREWAVAIACLASGLAMAGTQSVGEPLEVLAARCAPDVHPQTLKGLISTESSGNPFAIGVVGGRLERQPRTLDEAMSAARSLERAGYNFSLGLSQVNRFNLAKYGHTYATIFDPCANLKAGSAILKDCYTRARPQFADEQSALQAAFSCYYSGNFTRGFKPDHAGERSYVQKVVDNAIAPTTKALVVPAVEQRAGDPPASPASAGAAPGAQRQKLADSPWVVFPDQAKREAAEPEAEPIKAQRKTTSAAARSRSDRRQAAETPFVQILE